MTLGQKITNLRKARGMTQEALSETIGVTRQTISKWELDASTPDLDYLCKLCDLFGVTADYLIRPEKEDVEAAETAPSEPATPPSRTETIPPPVYSASIKTISGVRFAGWILFILGLISIPIAVLLFLFRIDSTALWILAGVFIIVGLELLLIRWKPLLFVMWTAWLFWTFVQFVLNSFVYILFTFTWASIFLIIWIFYTAFCIGATVSTIRGSIHSKQDRQ